MFFPLGATGVAALEIDWKMAKANPKNRLVENLASVPLTLSGEEIHRVAALKRPNVRIVSPPFAFDENA